MATSPTTVVIGTGVAGSAAALAAIERDESQEVIILERAPEGEHGGNSRWTDAYMRLNADGSPAENFVEDFNRFSNGMANQAIVETIADNAKETIDWLRGHGAAFEQLDTMFLTSNRSRLLPLGGGVELLNTLLSEATDRGVEIRYQTTAEELVRDETGHIEGIRVRDADGEPKLVAADAVIIAAGGFEGNPRMLTSYLDGTVSTLEPIAEGGLFNKGEGIQMAVDIGAETSGDFSKFHAEPYDPRAEDAPEPAIMAFPYGILVNKDGKRFVDEAEKTVDEHYEYVARRIWEQPEQIAYLIADQKLFDVPKIDHAIATPEDPIEATPDFSSDRDPLVTVVENLAAKIDVPAESLFETIESYNEGINDVGFDPFTTDGKRAATTPPKSNWAQPLDTPPFVAYPVRCANVFTFGGLATDTNGRVLTPDERPIPGLYAAGEVTGLYYGKYTGATSVLRGLVFGRIAGQHAAETHESS